MSVENLAGTGNAGFAERIWPVIDVQRRIRRLIEAEEPIRERPANGFPGAAIA